MPWALTVISRANAFGITWQLPVASASGITRHQRGRFRPHLAAEAVAVRRSGRTPRARGSRAKESPVACETASSPAAAPPDRAPPLPCYPPPAATAEACGARAERGIVAAYAQVVLRFLVVRLQLIVSDGPILQAGSGDRPEMRPQAECLGMIAPRHRAVINRAAAHAGGQRGMRPLARFHHAGMVAIGGAHGAHFVGRGSERGVGEGSGPAIARFHVAEGFQPRPALQQHHAASGSRQFLGDDAAAGARSDYDCVDHQPIRSRRPVTCAT